jgi:hypothetical protein
MNGLILKINGVRYLFRPDNELTVMKCIASMYAKNDMIEISDEETGEVLETIRVDELFNY